MRDAPTMLSVELLRRVSLARAAGTLHLDSTQSSVPSGMLHYTLANASSGATVKSEAVGCTSIVVLDVPAGGYRLTIDRPGSSGTDNLNLSRI